MSRLFTLYLVESSCVPRGFSRREDFFSCGGGLFVLQGKVGFSLATTRTSLLWLVFIATH